MACLAPDGKFSLFKNKHKKVEHWAGPSELRNIRKERKTFDNYIQHFMSKDISELLKRFNRNSSLYAKELKEKNKNIKKLLSVRKIFQGF